MKKVLIFFGVSVALMTQPTIAADLNIGSNTVFAQRDFLAKVQPSTCQYNFSNILPDINLTKDAPEIQNELNNKFNKTGRNKEKIEFDFTNCPPFGEQGKTNLTMKVSSRLGNSIIPGSEGLLQNKATGNDVAKNVFVQLLEEDGSTPVTFDKAIRKPLVHSGDTISFKFFARLYTPNSNATSGRIESTAAFVAEYE